MKPGEPSTGIRLVSPAGCPFEARWEDSRRRLLEYDPVRRSRRLHDLLEFLFRHAREDPDSRVDQYRLAFECFGMGSQFDASQSALVRVHLSRLRKVLEEYADGPGASDPLRITLPVGSYALEIREALAVERHPVRPILALVEFRGIGLEKEWNLFPGLVTELLGDRISRSGNFDVMGPFSRQMLGADEPDLPDLARKYGIDCFVDGSIQRRKDRIELRIRTIEGPSGKVIWTASENLPLGRLSLDGIEEDLLLRLSSVIGADYGGVDSHFNRLARVKPENSLSVYEAVLLGRMYFADFNPQALSTAIQRLRVVVREYPDEAMPKSTLAMLLANAGHEPSWPDLPPVAEIRELASEAVRLAPDDPWTILANGFAASFGGDDHEIRRIAIAAGSDPDAAAITKCGIGMLLCLRGIDSGYGLRLIHESSRMNPYQPRSVHVVEALVALRNGDLDGALAHLDIYRIPWGWADPLIRGAVHALRGDLEFAAGEYRAVLNAYPDFERAALEEGRLIWHREHMEFLFGIFAQAGITAASCV